MQAVLWRWAIVFLQITLSLRGGFGSSLSIAAAGKEANSDEYHVCNLPAIPDPDETEQKATV